MRLAFIDDSEQQNPAREGLGNLIAVGSVIVPDEQLVAFADRLAEIRADFGIPDSDEIKWKPPRGSYLATVGLEVLTALRCRMLEAAAACEVASAVVIVDHGRIFREDTTAEVGRTILAWLYERIEMHLTGHEDIGAVIADEPGGGSRAERRWLADTLQLTENGTRYVDAERVVLPIVTAPSDHVPHLQLADLVTAATTAAVAGRPSARALVDPLKRLAHTRSSGECGGAGIVLYPPALYDLYWWILGESHHRRGNVSAPLGPHVGATTPDPERPFLLHDGMPASSRAS
jgi:hypothetical protein